MIIWGKKKIQGRTEKERQRDRKMRISEKDYVKNLASEWEEASERVIETGWKRQNEANGEEKRDMENK